MTDKELKKLNRYQLLELLILQTERTDTLQQKLDALEAQMNQQNLKLTALGSSAKPSLQLEGVFQAAQNAADMYIKRTEEIEQETHQKAADILAQAQALETNHG